MTLKRSPYPGGGCQFHRVGKRQVILLCRIVAISVSGGGAIKADFARRYSTLQRFKGAQQSVTEFLPYNLAELRFGIMNVVDVNTLPNRDCAGCNPAGSKDSSVSCSGNRR